MPLEAYLFCQKHLAVQLLYHFKASSWWILRSFKQYLGVLQIFTSRSLNHPKMEKNYPHLEENFTHTYVSPRSHPCKQHCALACLKGCISAIPKQTILGFARNLMKGKLVFYEISTVRSCLIFESIIKYFLLCELINRCNKLLFIFNGRNK